METIGSCKPLFFQAPKKVFRMARSKAGNAILGGLKDCADSARLKDAGIFALKFGLYAVKVQKRR